MTPLYLPHYNKWKPFEKAKVSRTFPDPGASKYINKFTAATDGTCCHISSGGKDTADSNDGQEFQLEKNLEPDRSSLSFIAFFTNTGIEWCFENKSCPQFSYQIKVDGRIVESGIDPNLRAVDLKVNEKQIVELTLESIYGDILSKSLQF